MHELFRVLGQQMGMQKVRAILPESIDVLLNTSIVHCVRQITNSNVTTNFGNIVAIQKNKVSVINALRTLYTEREVNISYDTETYQDENDETQTRDIVLNPVVVEAFYDFDIFYLLDCNISYDEDSPYNYIAARLIEPNLIGEVERDYLLRPTKKFPAVTIVNVIENTDEPEESETSEESESTKGTVIDYNIYSGNNKPSKLKVSFIKYPAKVKFSETETERVDCDLPVHFHHMIVEEAVRLYLQSVYTTSGGLNANSEQQNNNNR